LSPFAGSEILHREFAILLKESVARSRQSARVEIAGCVLNEHAANAKQERFRENEHGIDETNETQRKK
jgi:hypothetical protein